eukprot:scaffold1317_cov38-Tisochrysis_lutea.AAC.2
MNSLPLKEPRDEISLPPATPSTATPSPSTPHSQDTPLGKASGPSPYTAAVPPSCSRTRGWPGTFNNTAPLGACQTNAMQAALRKSRPSEMARKGTKRGRRQGQQRGRPPPSRTRGHATGHPGHWAPNP